MDAFGPSLVVPSVNRFFHRVAEKKIRESSQSTVLSTLTTAYDVSKKGLRDRPTSLPVVLRLTSYLSDTNSILSQSSRPRPLSASCLRPSALRSVIDPPSKASLQRIEGSPTPDLHATRKQPEREHMDPECEGEQGSCVSRSLGTTEASACISPSEGFWDVVHKPAHGSSLDNDFISSSDFWHSPSAYAELSSEQIGYSPETSLEAHTSHEPLESTPRKRWYVI